MLAVAVTACAKKAAEKKNDVIKPSKVVATSQSQNPIPAVSEKNKSLCSVMKYDDSQRNISLSLFLRGEDADEERIFAGLIEELFVRDLGAKIITQSHKGQSTLQTFTSTDGVITGEEKELSPASNVTVCPDDGKYSKGSAESVALNATYFISKVNRKIQELLPEVKINPISVEVTPMIKKKLAVVEKGAVIWEYEAYDTDNAYYQPGADSITFLPHSEEFRQMGYKMNFWEVPMVAAHEYGHHIFETLNPTPAETTGLRNCFGKMGMKANVTEGDGEGEKKREVGIEDVDGALNEGFADLVSFYSLDNQERGLKGVPCLEIARDVSSKAFADGTVKNFTAAALESFFSEKEDEGASGCSVPNFQDIHILGAVFANGVDRFLSNSVDTKDQRLLIVLNWLQQMKVKQAGMKTLAAKDYLRESFKLFIETAVAKTDNKMDPADCALVTEIYPGLEASIEACRPEVQ